MNLKDALEALALKENNTLTSIVLRGNRIGDVGAQALAQAQALKENNTLTSITLEGNISATILEDINKQLEINKILAPLKNVGLHELRAYRTIIESIQIKENREILLEKMNDRLPEQAEISDRILQVIDKLIRATADPEGTIKTAQNAYDRLSAIRNDPKSEEAIENLANDLRTVSAILFSKAFAPFKQYKKASNAPMLK